MYSDKIKVLQSFGILLVVIGHSFPSASFYSPIISYIQKFIYSFHMPLFMAISGFLFYYNGGIKISYYSFVKKKFFRLIIPYIVLSSIAFLPKVILSKYALRPIEFTLSSFVKNLFYPWDNVIIFFWFLPTLFIIFIISPIFHQLQNSSYRLVCITTIILFFLNLFNPFLGIKFLNFEGVANYLVYFWLGCMMFRFYRKLIFNNKTITLFLIILTISLNIIEYKNTLTILIISIIGIAMSFSLSGMYLSKMLFFLNFIHGYSYQIYLLSWFPQTLFNIVFYKIIGLGFYITSLSMIIGGILIPIAITKIMNNKTKNLKIIIGDS